MKGNTNATPKVDKGIEILTLKLTLDGTVSESLNSATIIITDADKGEQTEYVYTQDGIVAPIDAGHSYTITCKRKGVAMPPVEYSATAIKDYQRSLTLNYTTAPTGVYIYTMDEQLKTVSEFSGTLNDVFGIYVGSSNAKLVLSKNVPKNTSNASIFGYYYWSGLEFESIELPQGLNKYTTPDKAQADFAGASNTEILMNANSNKNYAHYAAYNTIFPDGRHGFLPAAGQAKIIFDNQTAIMIAANKIGSTTWIPMFDEDTGISTSSFSYNNDSLYGQVTCSQWSTELWSEGGYGASVIPCYDLSV